MSPRLAAAKNCKEEEAPIRCPVHGWVPALMTQTPQEAAPTFEEAMTELEMLVRRMEEGEMALEESVEAYTRGTELIRLCRAKLDEAEARVKKLDEEQNGKDAGAAS